MCSESTPGNWTIPVELELMTCTCSALGLGMALVLLLVLSQRAAQNGALAF